jgi:hypothetical protein
MKPGETYPLLLKNINARYAFEIFRPDGTSVIEYLVLSTMQQATEYKYETTIIIESGF